MEHWGPLFQTLLWVGLTGCCVWRYHNRIDGLLKALQSRVEEGGGVKAGPFELTPKPQSVDAQVQKAAEEVAALTSYAPTVHTSHSSTADPKRLMLEVEDLALRAIQAQKNVTLQRQVALGNLMADAVFTSQATMNMVEVKYVPRGRDPHGILNRVVQKNGAIVDAYQWSNIRQIVALVFEDPADVKSSQGSIDKQAKSSNSMEVECITFTLEQLRKQFGLTAP